MKERLQKLIASAGLCARRTAEDWIAAGRVCVNGAVASLGDRADLETDTVTVDGAPLPGKPGAVYLMLNKPRGYVTTLSDEYGRRTAAELVADCGGIRCFNCSIDSSPTRTCAALAAKGISNTDVLQDNDAYHALGAVGGLIKTGATGTNVNDVTVLLLRTAE